MLPTHINTIFRKKFENMCKKCNGRGFVMSVIKKRHWWFNKRKKELCPACGGSGKSTK